MIVSNLPGFIHNNPRISRILCKSTHFLATNQNIFFPSVHHGYFSHGDRETKRGQ